VPLRWSVLRGGPDGAVAREVAAFAGLPGGVLAVLAGTLLIPAVQAVLGYWLGRALTPRRHASDRTARRR
jgi:hypothetical protein